MDIDQDFDVQISFIIDRCEINCKYKNSPGILGRDMTQSKSPNTMIMIVSLKRDAASGVVMVKSYDPLPHRLTAHMNE